MVVTLALIYSIVLAKNILYHLFSFNIMDSLAFVEYYIITDIESQFNGVRVPLKCNITHNL